jgi:hypothetical protein
MARRVARSRPALALAGAGIVIAIVVIHWWSPFVTAKSRAVESTPSLAGLLSRSTVHVGAGETACVKPVTFVAKKTIARFTVNARGRRPVPLRIVADAPGFHSESDVLDHPPGVDAPAEVTLAPAPRSVTGALCLTPKGAAVDLVGTNEPRSLAFADTFVGGKRAPSGVDAAVTLLEAHSTSLAGRTSAILDHASAFTGGWAPVWLLWPALVLVVVGLPAGALAALVMATGAQREPRPRQSPDA